MTVGLHGVFLHLKLFAIVSAPEEPFLVVEVGGEVARPGGGVACDAPVTSLPASREVHSLKSKDL